MDIKAILPFKMVQETPKEKWRHDGFWDKEPETIAWIKSFNDGDLFIDIGANIGMYSLYFASLYPKGFCIAIEPVISNIERLRMNMGMNSYTNILAQQCVMSNETAIVPIYIPDMEPGASGAQMSEAKDEHGKEFAQLQRAEDIMAFSLSDYIRLFDGHPHNLKRPTHIKIDVDGQEDKVLNGIDDWTNVQSILVEFNGVSIGDKAWANSFFTNMLSEEGFTIDNKFNNLPDHSRNRRQEEVNNVAENVVFTREG